MHRKLMLEWVHSAIFGVTKTLLQISLADIQFSQLSWSRHCRNCSQEKSLKNIWAAHLGRPGFRYQFELGARLGFHLHRHAWPRGEGEQLWSLEPTFHCRELLRPGQDTKKGSPHDFKFVAQKFLCKVYIGQH